MNAAKLGHRCLGLSSAEGDIARGRDRALRVGVGCEFEIQDLRTVENRGELLGQFDIAISTECIEHILDDGAVMRSLASMLRKGGSVLLTTPHLGYQPIDRFDAGPFIPIEDGRHVRKGYSAEQLEALCEQAGLELVRVEGCGGYFSQKLSGLLRALTRWRLPYLAAWILVLPLRLAPPVLDPLVRRTGWPDYSICVVARKPKPFDAVRRS